jgi:hypothetical protein
MKLWNYIVISVFLAFLFELAGIPVSGDLLEYVGIATTSSFVTNSALYLAIFGAGGILIGLGIAIAIGSLTKNPTENYVILPFIIGGMVLFMSTFTGIIIKAFSYEQWVGLIVSLILSPLLVGFIIAAVEFFRGTD